MPDSDVMRRRELVRSWRELGERLEGLREARRPFLEREPGPFFMGLPARWLDTPTWRCTNGHVSKRYLKSEATSLDLCLACQEPCLLTFPEDQDGPLTTARS